MDKAKIKFIEKVKEIQEKIIKELVRKVYDGECKEEKSIITNLTKIFNKIENEIENKKESQKSFSILEEVIYFLDGTGYTSKYIPVSHLEYKPSHPFFCVFEIIETIFKTCQLSITEKTNLIFYFVEKNLKNGILDCHTEQELVFLGDQYFFIDEEEVKKVLSLYHMALEDQEVEERYKEIAKKMVNDFINRAKIILKAHQTIKEHYIEKLNIMNEEDIEVIRIAIQNLGITENLWEEIKLVLLKKVQKNKTNSKETKEKIEIIFKNRNTEKKRILTKKEYNTILKQIEDSYNLEEQEVKRPLTLPEIIDLVNLLRQLKIPEVRIIKCIKTINFDDLYAYKNPLDKVKDYYEKMRYLEEDPFIKEALITIQDAAKEMTTKGVDKKSYYFWKSMILNEFKNISPLLNRDYTYELEEGTKLYRSLKKEESNE